MEPLHLSVARAFIGVTEIPGASSSPLILRWARDLMVPSWYDNDDKAWCAVFSNRVLLACQLPVSGRGFDLLRAASFLTWGEPVGLTLGAVLVFKRPEGHHVGFLTGERADAYRVLGGNQGNAVNETWIDKARLLAMRWPTGVALPTSMVPILLSSATPLSQNEV